MPAVSGLLGIALQKAATKPSGAGGWWCTDGNQLRKNTRCSDNLCFLKLLCQIHLDVLRLAQFYFTENNFTTNVPYPRLWATPHLCRVPPMKYPATSLPQGTRNTPTSLLSTFLTRLFPFLSEGSNITEYIRFTLVCCCEMKNLFLCTQTGNFYLVLLYVFCISFLKLSIQSLGQQGLVWKKFFMCYQLTLTCLFGLKH